MNEKADRKPHNGAVPRALLTALGLNVLLSGVLMASGLLADSSGLIANALDNTSDAAVYGISYFALTRGRRWKVRAARFSGVMPLVLCGAVLWDIVRRFVSGAEPVSIIMIAMTLSAAAINAISLIVLRRVRRRDVILRAAWIFSTNDFLSNPGPLGAPLCDARRRYRVIGG